MFGLLFKILTERTALTSVSPNRPPVPWKLFASALSVPSKHSRMLHRPLARHQFEIEIQVSRSCRLHTSCESSLPVSCFVQEGPGAINCVATKKSRLCRRIFAADL